LKMILTHTKRLEVWVVSSSTGSALALNDFGEALTHLLRGSPHTQQQQVISQNN